MATNMRPAAKQNASAHTMRAATPAPGMSVIDTRMPSFAASSPPEVAGSTNLLRTMCCRITPQTDSPTPVSTSAASRGSLLAVSVSQASPDRVAHCDHATSRAPTKSDAPHSAAKRASQRADIRSEPLEA